MLKFDAIVFDLDGTLWDSSQVVADSWNVAAKKLGVLNKFFTAEDITSIMGMPHKQIYEKMFPDQPEEKRTKIARSCYEEEIQLINQVGASLYPGVADGLAKLKSTYTLYLASNCLDEYLQTFLKWTGFAPLFKDSICHGHTGLGKGENLKILQKRNGFRSPVYIGDTSGDQRAAAEASYSYIHVTYGFGKPEGKPTLCGSFDELVKSLST